MGLCLSSSKRKVSGSSSQRGRGKEKEKEKGKSCSNIINGKRWNFGYDRDFDSNYAIGKLLGHGQFGYTYVATHKHTADRVAVKRIEKKKMVLPIAVEDVKREVKILHALTGHENVVQFYNAFEDDDFVYIVMELCEGGELLDRILEKKDSRYSEKDAAKVVRQMLKVAACCHLHGVVHRDMKPEVNENANFLFKSIKEDSPLKATDFGLSDFIKPGKKFQDIVGSAYYVAPEVLKRKSGPESDVWMSNCRGQLLFRFQLSWTFTILLPSSGNWEGDDYKKFQKAGEIGKKKKQGKYCRHPEPEEGKSHSTGTPKLSHGNLTYALARARKP
ncbi:hypothetical protein KI387_013138 [Taxus chinensis]|uniref:Protein kinase domain-containing protein n=1 Tax=Taxus chinensis TaxID=29808 RepID=A0AA38FGL1_TAXCH|nr:hypothetical protein KI387_013138 [Taxus chinensis]